MFKRSPDTAVLSLALHDYVMLVLGIWYNLFDSSGYGFDPRLSLFVSSITPCFQVVALLLRGE
jgi:hypothetical protein